MIPIKKTTLSAILAALLAACILPVSAQNAAPADEKLAEKADKNATKFIQVDRDQKNVRLQTGITTYEKDGVSVDLIGAIHIADAKYYKQLNKQFTQYDSLLFEMVGGDQMVNGKMPNKKEAKNEVKDPLLAMLGNVYGIVGKMLKLQSQNEGIDYTPINFVHADLSLEAFEKLQAEKGESLLGFALQNAQNAQNGAHPEAKQPDMQKLLIAVLSGNSNGIKLELVDTLGGAADQMAGMMGQSVIIGDRNAACLKVLDEQVKVGKKKLGIFYGAAHFPFMEKEMLKTGYKKTNHQWLTAWDIPKVAAAVPAAKEKEAPAATPDTA